MAKRKKASMPKGEEKATRQGRKALAPPSPLHNINIKDTNENWRKWGFLVYQWIEGYVERPKSVGTLKAQMRDAGLTDDDFFVVGDDDRVVEVNDYPGTGTIVIPVPTPDMVARDKAELARIAALPAGQRRYPSPQFYNLIYGGVPKVDFTLSQMYNMALRRLGEYVINECM